MPAYYVTNFLDCFLDLLVMNVRLLSMRRSLLTMEMQLLTSPCFSLFWKIFLVAGGHLTESLQTISGDALNRNVIFSKADTL